MGRDWIAHLEVNLKTINVVEPPSALRNVIDKYTTVFNEELGCLKGPPVKLSVHEKARPKFFKPRSVPLLYKKKVEAELEILQEKGVISPVQFSPWAAPVVPILKKSGKAPTETYPLPRVDELFANLSGGKLFSKLDYPMLTYSCP